jgi:hypothetical protein
MNGAHFETLRDVSQTLVDLLKTNLDDVKNKIALASPKDPGVNLLTLFLYRVTENPDLRNADRLVGQQANGRVVQRRAPLSLDAYYLLTAHGPDLLAAHQALSRAMRVFYDNGVLQGSLLRATDPGKGLTELSVLRLTFDPLSMEEMARIWSVFPDTGYEISVGYLVTPVEIDSEREVAGAPVVDQVHEHGQRGAELESVRS